MAERSYATSVVLGLAGAGLAAVAASREWASTRADSAGIKVQASVTGAESQPLVPALALVALAAWGVVLVMRGRMRRLVAAVGLLAALGAAAVTLLGLGTLQDDALQAAVARGATGDTFATNVSAWYYLTLVGAFGTAVAFAVAVLRSPSWPAMGAKYDAPAGRAAVPAADEDMWRALDEGRDPTS
ncbi:Trp biosynthesis-associated membrane protein [Nocardioides pakistanensis]